jgi:L-rhamnose mutarotase
MDNQTRVSVKRRHISVKREVLETLSKEVGIQNYRENIFLQKCDIFILILGVD